MQIRTILFTASVLGLAACGGGGGGDYERSPAAPAPMMAEEAIVVEADMGFSAKSSGPTRPRDEHQTPRRANLRSNNSLPIAIASA